MGMPDTNEELSRLLQEAALAPPGELVPRFWTKVASYGAEALPYLLPWLIDDQRRGFAGVTIRRIADLGDEEIKASARDTVLAVLQDVRPSSQSFLTELLRDMGWTPPGRFPPGTQFTPIHGAITAQHAVVDLVQDSGTAHGAVYLTADHWAFSVRWVEEHGGLSPDPGDRYCWFCSKTFNKARAQ
jgi:hypothetical protein